MELTLKRPEIEDLPRMNALIVASKQSWGYSATEMALWLNDIQATAADLHNKEYWLAENIAGQLVFVYSIAAISHTQYTLEDLWVTADLKGRGLGRRAFDHLLANLNEKQAKLLSICADPNAEGFYLSMGAVKVDEQDSAIDNRKLPILQIKFPNQD